MESRIEHEPGTATRAAAARRPSKSKRKRHTWWLKQLHTWHWISAAVSLAGMVLFAVTGITLNHAASISAKPIVTDRSGKLPTVLVASLVKPARSDSPLPAPVAEYVANRVGLDVKGKGAEWSEGEVYVALPRPGGDAWVSIDRGTGEISAEVTTRGWVSYLNDLHKGRNTGPAWSWFIDIFAGFCILFTLTGLLLLQLHSKHRPSTWPLVGLSLFIPLILALFFIH